MRSSENEIKVMPPWEKRRYEDFEMFINENVDK